MAITLVMDFAGMTAAKYDAVLKDLGLDKQSAQWPKGVISHMAGPLTNGWGVVDVWESQAAWDEFFSRQLMPSINRVGGIPKPVLQIFTVHNSHGIPIHATK